MTTDADGNFEPVPHPFEPERPVPGETEEEARARIRRNAMRRREHERRYGVQSRRPKKGRARARVSLVGGLESSFYTRADRWTR